MVEPQVTIVVVPRERFSCARESLESIYAHTTVPFTLVYVDGGSPRHIRQYLQAQARERHFHLVRTNYYLSPNRARNLGLGQVSSKYVVFIDNDVIVAPGWLDQLVRCAEETSATIVGPLICEGRPVHEIVHCAGGESSVTVAADGERAERRIVEKIYKQGRRVAYIRDQLQRQQTGLAEFHCMLVRSDIFERLGSLDEAILNTKEHVDFCMTVTQAGGTIYFEPASVVTYVPGPLLEWSDIPFYMLRWSDAWELGSLYRLRDKWNLTEDRYFRNRYRHRGWRRTVSIIEPLSHRLAFGHRSKLLKKFLVAADKVLNQCLTTHYAWRHAQHIRPRSHTTAP